MADVDHSTPHCFYRFMNWLFLSVALQPLLNSGHLPRSMTTKGFDILFQDYEAIRSRILTISAVSLTVLLNLSHDVAILRHGLQTASVVLYLSLQSRVVKYLHTN